jgi:hypothetical protein
MSKPMNIRISDVHLALLEKTVEKLTQDGIKTNKTDVIQKAIYSFARDYALDEKTINKIIDQHYMEFDTK